MKPIEDMSVGELGALVAGHLKKHGIDVVLSGGACVMLYAEGRYVSRGLDFVRMGLTRQAELRAALAELGFVGRGRILKHDKCSYALDFPEPPLAVGKEPPQRIVTLTFSTGPLRILSPTDCVKDRLANYYHHNDAQSLEQAILVAREKDVDLQEVRRWSEQEEMLSRFEKIADRLGNSHGPQLN